MSRKSRRFDNDSNANGKVNSSQIVSLFASAEVRVREEKIPKKIIQEKSIQEEQNRSFRFGYLKEDWKKRVLYPVLGVALLAMLCLGAMANSGWLPHTDAMSDKQIGWFGKETTGEAVTFISDSDIIDVGNQGGSSDPFLPSGVL